MPLISKLGKEIQFSFDQTYNVSYMYHHPIMLGTN